MTEATDPALSPVPPEVLPPYPTFLPPPPSGEAFTLPSWQPFIRVPRSAWLPPVLVRPPLTAQLVIAATVQFIAAAVMFLIATAALLLSVSVNSPVDLVALGVPTILCVVHLGCALLALARKHWAAWAGYALLVVEVFMLVALTL